MFMGVYVSTIKRKNLVGMTLNLALLHSPSKHIDFGFKRQESEAEGPLACALRLLTNPR